MFFYKKYLLVLLILFIYDGYSLKKSFKAELQQDSLILSRTLWRIKSSYVKDRIKKVLNDIDKKNRFLKNYAVQFYGTDDFRKEYKVTSTRNMEIEEITDSLSKMIRSANILRIKQLNLKGYNFRKKVDYLYEYYILEEQDPLKNSDSLLAILSESILDMSKKVSLEWIWARSPNSDAYFSTRLSILNGEIAMYPVYRTYLGQNSFGSFHSWLDKLKIYDPDYKNKLLSEPKDKIFLHKVNIEKEQVGYEELDTLSDKDLEDILNNISFGYLKYPFSIQHFHKKNKGYVLSKTEQITLKELFSQLRQWNSRAVCIKAQTSDFTNSQVEQRIYKNLKRQILLQSKVTKDIIEVIKSDQIKQTWEWIIEKLPESHKYSANLVSIYNGVVTIFYDYAIIASQKDRARKWFQELPEKKYD